MLHDRIKECRLRAGLSQAQLATRLGVSRQAVTKWESGRVAVPRDGSSSVSRRTRHRCTEVPGPEAMPGATRRGRAGAPAPGPGIQISGVSKSFSLRGGKQLLALQDTDLHTDKGSFLALLGPSGCGKSTILRILAALDPPSSGTALVDGNTP
ncbi:MAG: helix-turn-helix domain-containing protein, partial [Micrococcales bacterium]|nr:helix-turn-helix domain-containing protein [Micrococcales bacterium]